MDKITSPHDKLFRETWSNKEVAADFLRNYLPEDVLSLINLNSLEICKDSFVDDDLKEYHSDLLCKIMLENHEGYVYLLFEHKSYPDRLIHLQLLEYMLRIWRLHLRQGKNNHLSVVIPMVLYHGEKKWSYGTKFSTLFSKFSENLKPYIPDFEFILRDLTQYSDEEIRGMVLYRVVLLLFKHIFDPDIAQKLPGIFSAMKEVVESEGGLRFFEKILRYLSNTADGITPNELKRMVETSLSREKGDLFMTIAERLRKEGYEQAITMSEKVKKEEYERGVRKGIRKGILEAIEIGLSLKFGDDGLKTMSLIRRIRKSEKLDAIKNMIRTAKDLSELTAML